VRSRLDHEIYLWICDRGHYVGMSTLGTTNPNYIDNSKKTGKKLPKCPHCRRGKTRRLYRVTGVKLVKAQAVDKT